SKVFWIQWEFSSNNKCASRIAKTFRLCLSISIFLSTFVQLSSTAGNITNLSNNSEGKRLSREQNKMMPSRTHTANQRTSDFFESSTQTSNKSILITAFLSELP